MASPEYWVMRILTHPKPAGAPECFEPRAVRWQEMTGAAALATFGLITSGHLAALPDGRIGEPAEVFSDEGEARDYRKRIMLKHPGEEFAVIMNVDVQL